MKILCYLALEICFHPQPWGNFPPETVSDPRILFSDPSSAEITICRAVHTFDHFREIRARVPRNSDWNFRHPTGSESPGFSGRSEKFRDFRFSEFHERKFRQKWSTKFREIPRNPEKFSRDFLGSRIPQSNWRSACQGERATASKRATPGIAKKHLGNQKSLVRRENRTGPSSCRLAP